MNEEMLPAGWFCPGDIEYYRHIYQDLVPIGGMTAEIGIYRGRSLMSVADIIREKNIRVYAVDTFLPYEHDKSTDLFREFCEICTQYGVSHLVTPMAARSVVASKAIEDASLDFVFIDGDHDYLAVREDIRAWKPKIRAGGWIGGHDYKPANINKHDVVFPPPTAGVTRAVMDMFAQVETRPDSMMWLTQADGPPAPERYVRLAFVLPSYSPGGVATVPISQLQNSRKLIDYSLHEVSGSALTMGFNVCWCWALNMRKRGLFTHLLMLHSDIRPLGDDWFDRFVEQMEISGADVLSAISPIKDGKGVSSTALETDNFWRPQRITMGQAKNVLPITWTSDKLLLNTGMMLVNLAGDWVEQVYFHIDNKIIKREDGTLMALFEPEDWKFSRLCRELGVKIFATRAVDLFHLGHQAFPSGDVWGYDVDPDNAMSEDFNIMVTDARGGMKQFWPSKPIPKVNK